MDLLEHELSAPECTPGCLLAMDTTPDQCQCRCGGRYHAVLIWAPIVPNTAQAAA